MKKIDDISEITSLMKVYMKKEILTNNYIMPAQYQAYIDEGVLYYEQTDLNMAFLIDCKTYWRVYYSIKDVQGDMELPKDKPVVMEIVFSKRTQTLKEAVDFWVKQGFSPYLERLRMSLVCEDFRPTHDRSRISLANINEAALILETLSAAFDPYLGCIPSLEELIRAIEVNEIIVARDDQEKLLGILHIGQKNTTFFIWHLLVLPEARGKGISKKLLTYFIEGLSLVEKAKVQLWVKCDNIAARSLYETSGFQYDGWETTGLIRK